MTLTDGQSGPGQETAPAFAMVPQTLHRTELTWRDALVWEQLPRELRGLEKLSLVGLIVAFGMILTLCEPYFPVWMFGFASVPFALVTVTLAYGSNIVVLNLQQRRRARRRLPIPQSVATAVLTDRLHQTWANGAQIILTLADTRQTVLTPHLLFIESATSLAILPQACFDSPEAMAKFAEQWESTSLAISQLQDMELPVRA